eukprot:c46029_g1_i1 orf=2-160(-)
MTWSQCLSSNMQMCIQAYGQEAYRLRSHHSEYHRKLTSLPSCRFAIMWLIINI